MKLGELKPEWIKNQFGCRIGVRFLCPVCLGGKNRAPFCMGRIGVIFANPLEGPPNEGGYTRIGDTFDTLTLTRPIFVTEGCEWHGMIARGDVTTKK